MIETYAQTHPKLGRFYASTKTPLSAEVRDVLSKPDKEPVAALLAQGEIFPSITTVLRAFKASFLDKEGDFAKITKIKPQAEVKNYYRSSMAREVGTATHAAIEGWLTKGALFPAPGSPMERDYHLAAQIFLANTSISPIEVERTLWADGFTGTIDLLGCVNSRISCIDWKTGKALDLRKGFLQLAGQVLALEAEGFEAPEFCGLIWLRPDGIPRSFPLSTSSKAFEQAKRAFLTSRDSFYQALGVDRPL